MLTDILERFTFENKPLRGEHVYLANSIQTILKQHSYTNALKQLLAESLAIVSLLSAMIKLEGRITLQFHGKNELKLLLAQCTHRHEIRGLIKPENSPKVNTLSYAKLMEQMKEGILVVMLEFDARPDTPYQAIVPWTGNTMMDAIEAYFENSEQLLTKIWLHYDILHETIAGCMLQALPSQEGADTLNLEFFNIAQQMQIAWKQPNDHIADAKTFLTTACSHDDIRLFSPVSIAFRCRCERTHFEQAIKVLGIAEAEDEIAKNGELVVTCEFCTRTYHFDKIDIAAIFKDSLNDSSSDAIH
jgi:molecular chaperone Hsp33